MWTQAGSGYAKRIRAAKAADRKAARANRPEAAPVVVLAANNAQPLEVKAASRPCRDTQDAINQYLANNVVAKEQKRYKRWGER